MNDKGVASSWRESRTFRFVSISWAVVTARFMVGGIGADFGGFSFQFPVMGAGEYGAAIAAILAVWLGREFKEAWRPNAD